MQGLDTLTQVKFFTPDSNWTWYATEFDGQDIFFGLVVSFDIEVGYLSLSKLLKTMAPRGLPIERNLNFKLKHLKEFLELNKNN